MGNMHKAEFASGEFCTREVGMMAHLESNFYPPLHVGHKTDITKAFTEHWAGDLDDHEELAKRCWLIGTDALYRYFDSFLNEFGDDC